MSALSASHLVSIWEESVSLRLADRALNVLHAAYPHFTRGGLAALSIGTRDSFLLAVHEDVFGHILSGFAECPSCAEQLEFSIETTQLRGGSQFSTELPAEDQSLQMIVEDVSVRFRLPNSTDLAAMTKCNDADAGRRVLLERCVLQASYHGNPVPPRELSDPVVAKLAACVAERDPLAEVLLDLDCRACKYRWQVLLDIASFLWDEVSALARRLLREVDVLARAYGWREADILAMSATRREFYLGMVG